MSISSSAALTPQATNESNHSQYLEDLSSLQITFTPQEIQILRNVWARVKSDPASDDKVTVHGSASAFFCQQFYENLLGEFHELKVLFPSIKHQVASMAGILTLVISQLDNLTRVQDIIISLGKRHSRVIGVEVEHYELVGNALLKTLQDRIESDFTVELENAWIKLYTFIANLMLQAGEDPPVPANSLLPVLTPMESGSSYNSESLDITQNPLKKTNYNTMTTTNSGGSGGPSGTPGNRTLATRKSSLTKTPSENQSGNYHPSFSHFRAPRKAKKAANGKGQDCSVM